MGEMRWTACKTRFTKWGPRGRQQPEERDRIHRVAGSADAGLRLVAGWRAVPKRVLLLLRISRLVLGHRAAADLALTDVAFHCVPIRQLRFYGALRGSRK